MASTHKSTFATACSTRNDTLAALADVCESSQEQLGCTPNLAALFLSPHHLAQTETVAKEACQRLGTENLLGCAGEAIVGTGQEIEGQPALSLWLAHLPGAEVIPTYLQYQPTSEGDSFSGWPDQYADDWPVDSTLLVLGDPFSFPADRLLVRVNEDQAGRCVIGGMASAASKPGENRLLLGSRVYDEGAVGMFLPGNVRVRTVVSQGCRPIGNHFIITRAEQNVIHELGGISAYERLKEIYQTLATHEQEMVQRGLHLGRVVNEYQDRFEQGDFLVRNVMGLDPERGAMMIGDLVRPGQSVQFHVRDAQTADAELKQLLAEVVGDESRSPQGALLFTCNGRGTRLFPEPHHDAAAIQAAFGSIPVAGFFAAGEIGPIGGSNFLHGFTASIALFETD